MPPLEPRLEPLETGGYDKFWSLFQQTVPTNVSASAT